MVAAPGGLGAQPSTANQGAALSTPPTHWAGSKTASSASCVTQHPQTAGLAGIPINCSTHTAAASWRVGSVAEPTQRKSQIQQYRGCTARSAHLYQPLISGAMVTPMSEPTPTGTPMEAACAQVWQGGTPPDWRRQQAAAAAQGGDGASAARAAPGAAIGAGSMSAAAVPRLHSQSGRRGHPAPAASPVCCDHISWEPGPLTRLRELPIVLLMFARAATGAVRAAGRCPSCSCCLLGRLLEPCVPLAVTEVHK